MIPTLRWYISALIMAFPFWIALFLLLKWRKQANSQAIERRPFWNLVAAVLQVIALLGGVFALMIFGQRESLIGLLYAVPTYTLFALFGTIAAFVAVIRHERWPVLSWVALFINGVPGVICLQIIAQKVNL
jgi:quinol-cytochrome oxidoreductase complex cytochrome b subunit